MTARPRDKTNATGAASIGNATIEPAGDILDNCIFCKIVAGQIPSKKLHEDDDLIAFHDINPAGPVHFLIVPKEHVATLSSCEERHAPLLGKMMLLAARLAKEQGVEWRAPAAGEAGPGTGGYKTLFNTGPDGGQEVYHLHLHVIGGAHPWRVHFART